MSKLDKVEIALIFGVGLWLCGVLVYFTYDTTTIIKKQDRISEECRP